MRVIISAHCDTVFAYPCASWEGDNLIGACDNLAGMFACALAKPNIPDSHMEFTEDEEMYMDGARSLGKLYDRDNTLFVVIDVTERNKNWKNIHFTIENWHRIEVKHIKKALSKLSRKYKMNQAGTESEAWLYKDLGFPVIEIDVPVKGGLHNLESVARGVDIYTTAEAIKYIYLYFKDKNVREVVSEVG